MWKGFPGLTEQFWPLTASRLLQISSIVCDWQSAMIERLVLPLMTSESESSINAHVGGLTNWDKRLLVYHVPCKKTV